jgi:hypothetical protein
MKNYKIKVESSKYKIVYIEAIKPTRKDLWRIWRGTYEPQVRRVERATPAGFNKMLRDVFSGPRITKQLFQRSDWLERMKGGEKVEGKTAYVPLHKP